MEYITRGVCDQEGCRETRYYLDNGLWFCRRGHQQEVWPRQRIPRYSDLCAEQGVGSSNRRRSRGLSVARQDHSNEEDTNRKGPKELVSRFSPASALTVVSVSWTTSLQALSGNLPTDPLEAMLRLCAYPRVPGAIRGNHAEILESRSSS